MDKYELYCQMDPVFYDRIETAVREGSDYPQVSRDVPAGWRGHATDTWMYFMPEGDLPAQGWKIHVSTRLGDAQRVLDVVWEYCLRTKLAFKFLRGEHVLVMHNSKAADRASSGKFVTLYPRDELELERVLAELDPLLEGVEGPYVLSDLRYGDGPMYVRYGAFTERKCLNSSGERVLAVEDGEGTLVPDVRGVAFTVPDWTSLPAFLEPHLAARNAVTLAGLPYTIESVFQFSNGGGVYLARDRDGRQVVLKEARPGAGLDSHGRDAVTRSRHEREMLERLAGLDVVPELVDYFELGGHEFLVEEFVDGNPLQRLLVQKYPLTSATCTEGDLAEYTAWVTEMLPKAERAVAALHDRGVVFGDLHPNNILVTAEGRLVLIDFEVATLAEQEARPALAHPAFLAPADRGGVEADRYALACLTLGLFAPQATITLPLHAGKADHLARLVIEAFPVEPAVIDEAVATLTRSPADTRPRKGLESLDRLVKHGREAWPEVRGDLHHALLASATPERDDRLFPGDVAQFEGSGAVNIATGSAGVLLALYESGAGRFPEYEDWTADRALRPGSGLGLYDGALGVAHVLNLLGDRSRALSLAERCLEEPWQGLELGLFSGLAGMALALTGLGMHEAADAMAAGCAERIGGPRDVPELSGGGRPRAGLMHGSSGVALLFLDAYERHGDPAWLDKAHDAIRQDLRRCVHGPDGSLQVNQGWRRLPYLEEGSAGIAPVVARYLRHRPDEMLALALDELRLVGRARYFVQPGLFSGRAGIIAGLPHDDPNLPELIAGLRWHALPFGGGLAFPGDQLLRLSMDFSTGTAGILHALNSALEGRTLLPFLEPRDGRREPLVTSGGTTP
ncbi:class III lanthionine synthetase LanKC [Actinocorallia longicatena]|uniref:non-specific serine/threonine protein kinase n=1 Tax=Actinocorallia longicatena TaxID=111803 RepID=A0ABP6QEU3_9ACTN